MTARAQADAHLARSAADPHRLDRLARDVRALQDTGKRCGELPEDYRLRVEGLHMLSCIEPVSNGKHEGSHINRLGERWAQRRRLTAIERVEERRPASW